MANDRVLLHFGLEGAVPGNVDALGAPNDVTAGGPCFKSSAFQRTPVGPVGTVANGGATVQSDWGEVFDDADCSSIQAKGAAVCGTTLSKTPLSSPGYRPATPTHIAAGSAGGPSHAKNNRLNNHVNPEQQYRIFHPPPVVCQHWNGILNSKRSCPAIFILAMAASLGIQTAALAMDAFVAPVSGRTQAIAAVEARLAKLQNVTVGFHMDVDFTPSPAVLAAMRSAYY